MWHPTSRPIGEGEKWKKVGDVNSRPFAVPVVARSPDLPIDDRLVRTGEGTGSPQIAVALFKLQSMGDTGKVFTQGIL